MRNLNGVAHSDEQEWSPDSAASLMEHFSIFQLAVVFFFGFF